MKIKKHSKFIMVLLLFALIAISLSKKTEVYTVGVNIDRSGPLSENSEEQIKAIELSLSHFNVSGGFDGTFIKLQIMDNKSDIDTAISIQRDFAENNSIFATLSFSTPEVEKAIAGISNDLAIPNVFMSINNKETSNESNQNSNYNYRIAVAPKFQGFIAANFVKTVKKYSNVFVYINNEDSNSHEIATLFNERLDKIKGHSTIYNEENLSEMLNDLRSDQSVKAIVLTSSLEYNLKAIKSIREVNRSIPIVTFSGDNEYHMDMYSQSYLNNTFLLDHYAPNNETQFSKDFDTEYGHIPNKFGTLSYDSTNLVLDSLVRANISDRNTIKNTLDETYHLSLISGRISIDSYNNAYKSMIVRSFSNNRERQAITVFPE